MKSVRLIFLLQKTRHNHNTDSQMAITFTYKITDHINMTFLLNNELCQFPIKNVHLCQTFKYTIPLGKKTFNFNSFLKSSTSNAVLMGNCNDSAYKMFID